MDDFAELLDEILVDAHGDAEQLTAFEVEFSERARFPFPAQIVGSSVDVVRGRVRGGREARPDSGMPAPREASKGLARRPDPRSRVGRDRQVGRGLPPLARHAVVI